VHNKAKESRTFYMKKVALIKLTEIKIYFSK